MLKPKALTQVLSQANSGGVQSTLYVLLISVHLIYRGLAQKSINILDAARYCSTQFVRHGLTFFILQLFNSLNVSTSNFEIELFTVSC